MCPTEMCVHMKQDKLLGKKINICISIIHNGPEVEMHSVSGEYIENKVLHGD